MSDKRKLRLRVFKFNRRLWAQFPPEIWEKILVHDEENPEFMPTLAALVLYDIEHLEEDENLDRLLARVADTASEPLVSI